MSSLDRRLLRCARAARWFLASSVALGSMVAVLVVVQAAALAEVVSRVFVDGVDLASVRTGVLVLGLALLGRALAAWSQEIVAHRCSATVKSELRLAQVRHVLDLGPSWLTGRRSAELTALTTRGIEALDGYFARYLPQLVLAVLVPVALVVVIAVVDPLSAALIAVTLPLIPLFMAVIGKATTHRQTRQWDSLQRLAGHFLDVVVGLATLKTFGRAKVQTDTVRAVSDANRRATMSVLRVAFLSSFTLELLATLSVALVAVEIGLRLVGGSLDLRSGLFVLVLAPEAYLPLRLVGAHYHASAEGKAAVQRVFEVLDSVPEAATAQDPAPAPDLRTTRIRVVDLTVRYPDRHAPALDDLDLALTPGTVTVVTGPSGAGKSTLLSVLLGLTAPSHGRVLLEQRAGPPLDLAGCDPVEYRRQLAWVPQRPYLFTGTVADNVRLGVPDASDEAVRAALGAAGFANVDRELRDGPSTEIRDGGAGLSAGQQRRVALARAMLRDAPLLLLDEPTAALDAAAEQRVLVALERLVRGRTVVIATHRTAVLSLADRVVHLSAPRQPTDRLDPVLS